MAEQQAPRKHVETFTLSDSGKARADDLLSRCGHNSLQLLIARGLALVEWVVDQQERGRTVAGVVYGTEDTELYVCELHERPELLMPRQRPQALPVPAQEQQAAKVAEPAELPAPAAESIQASPEPVASQAVAPTQNPKLMPRAKNPPAPKPRPTRIDQSKQAAVLAAHRPNDDGAVKTYNWVVYECERKKRLPPICHGDKPLQGELSSAHYAELSRVEKYAATHFRISDYGDLSFYRFEPKRGWLNVNVLNYQGELDEMVTGGCTSIFPIALALDYLAKKYPEVA